MSHGLPSIGLRSCAGVRELIIDGVNGLLTDSQGLSQALDELMSAPDARCTMGRAALKHVAQYQPNETFHRWDDLLNEVAPGS
jgi:glycosyltransferase involved in cell wall biosynthesis